jgi:hypothetical protein
LARLREVEDEARHLRQEIEALENSAAQTEKAMDSLLVTMRSGNRLLNLGNSLTIEDDRDGYDDVRGPVRTVSRGRNVNSSRRGSNSIAYLNHSRSVPSITANIEPISHRFSDRTITQACTLLLRESGKPLHVNELYNLLVAGGMRFKGNNPTISIAVSLNRNRRFRKVDPGTFDLVMREASQAAS